jgi:uncharacterized protein (DUF488 family)
MMTAMCITVLTIGHSNHEPTALLDLLRRYVVAVVVDVRSSPYSRYASHFNREVLRENLRAEGFGYEFMGGLLGGLPDGDEFYDDAGYVRYDRIAESAEFQRGLSRLVETARTRRVAVLCSEEDPTGCHRRLLIGRVLAERGAEVLHIRGDGQVQSEQDLAAAEEFRKTKGQLTLFDMEEERDEWKSSRSASPGRRPPNSSNP